MTILHYKIHHKLTLTTISKRKIYSTSIRTVMRATQAGPRLSHNVARLSSNSLSRRHYPGERRIIKYNKDMSEHDKKRLGLTDHEIKHDNVQNTSTGHIEGLLTSSQNKDGSSPVKYDKIDSVKVNGTFIHKIDPTTKQPILDNNGNKIPDPNKGGQWIATYKQPRRLTEEARGYYRIKTEAQLYMDTHEETIRAIVEKNQEYYKSKSEMQCCKKIGGIDDE